MEMDLYESWLDEDMETKGVYFWLLRFYDPSESASHKAAFKKKRLS